jgi:hypothetical protein
MMGHLVANTEKMKTNQEKIMAKTDGHHERAVARMDSQLEKKEDAVDVFEEGLDKMDTTDLEAN